MTLQKINKFFNNPKIEATKLSSAYHLKGYGGKVEFKNSIKWNLLLLISMIILSIYLLSNISTHKFKWVTVVFCAIIILYPTIKLFNQSPILTISKQGILFRNRKLVQWTEIALTQIEEMDSDKLTYRLHITFNGKTKIIDLTDLNYSKDEISHIVEYYKGKNAS